MFVYKWLLVLFLYFEDDNKRAKQQRKENHWSGLCMFYVWEIAESQKKSSSVAIRLKWQPGEEYQRDGWTALKPEGDLGRASITK